MRTPGAVLLLVVCGLSFGHGGHLHVTVSCPANPGSCDGCVADTDCWDDNVNCPEWATIGLCINFSSFCQSSCGLCSLPNWCLPEYHTVLNDIWRLPNDSSRLHNDYNTITSGQWYRFTMNGKNAVIATGIFGYGQCGTEYGISFHMDPAEPPEGYAVEAWVGDVFHNYRSIIIRRCKGFTVYKLEKVDLPDQAYCVIPL